MRALFGVLATFVVLLAAVTPPVEALRLQPLPEVSLQAAVGPLDTVALTDLALLVSGAAPGTQQAYRGVLEAWTQEFLAQGATSWGEEKRAEALLQFLHGHLKAYSLYQTRLDVLIDRGTYNCVSSAVAYMILGRKVGLDVQAVATDDHAFALVRLGDGREVDVETTTRYGYDPGTKTEFTNAFGRTGFAYVPPGHYDRRRTIGDRQLLGLLVQNRMAEFQRAGRPEDAVGPAIDRWVFEATPEAFRTLVDGFVNYGSYLNARKEYSKGLDLVVAMADWTGPVPEAKELAWAFLNNHVNALLERQDFAGSQALTLAWKNRGYLTDAQAAATQAIIADRQLAVAVKSQAFGEAAASIERAFAQGLVTSARRQELLTYVYGQEVQRRAAAQGPSVAWLFLQGLPAEVRAWPTLVKAQDIYAYNWSVEVHNRFAQLWNSGKKDEARRALNEALGSLPNSPLLKKDLVLSQVP